MEGRYKKIRDQFASALKDFENALDIDTSLLDEVLTDVVMSGQIQKFEFTVELAWKVMKAYLYEIHGVEVASPKESIRKFFELGNADYELAEELITLINMRNILSHVYDKEYISKIYDDIVLSAKTLKKLAACF